MDVYKILVISSLTVYLIFLCVILITIIVWHLNRNTSVETKSNDDKEMRKIEDIVTKEEKVTKMIQAV